MFWGLLHEVCQRRYLDSRKGCIVDLEVRCFQVQWLREENIFNHPPGMVVVPLEALYCLYRFLHGVQGVKSGPRNKAAEMYFWCCSLRMLH